MAAFPLRLCLVLSLLASACGPYDPCDDKACGAPCTLCDPDDDGCVETGVPKVCNRNSVCTEAQPPQCG